MPRQFEVTWIMLYCVLLSPLIKSNHNFEINQKRADIFEIAQVLQHFNEEVFLLRTTTLSIAAKTQTNKAKYFFRDLINELLQPLSDLKVQITCSEEFKDYEYYILLLIDSYASFRKIGIGPRTEKRDFSEFYLIVLYTENSNWLEEIQYIFDYCWSYNIVNAVILVHQKIGIMRSPTLYTYYPFTPEHCNKATVKQLSVGMGYKNSTLAELYPNKFKNFHKCALIAALWNVPPYLMLPRTRANPMHFDGMEGHLLGVLAASMNFTIDYVVPSNNEQRGLILKNGTVTGAVRLLQNKHADLSLGSFRCTLQRSKALSSSRPFYQTMQVFTVLAVQMRWTTYEILSYSFEFWVWITIGCVILKYMLSTVVLRYFQPKLLKFVYGSSNIQLIIFNVISVAFGQPAQTQLKRNFARFLCCLWLFSTLILRSAYQGLLYNYLSGQKTIAPPSTALQLTQRDYSLVVNAATADSFSEIPIIRDKQLKVLVMNITDMGGFAILEANSTMRFVTGTPRDFLTYYVMNNAKFGVFHVVKETIFPQQLCIYFAKHSYLTTHFDDVLLNLQSFGLIDHWGSEYMDYSVLEKAKEELMEPLNMDELYGAFQIQCSIWILAGIVFLAELWSLRCRKRGNGMFWR